VCRLRPAGLQKMQIEVCVKLCSGSHFLALTHAFASTRFPPFNLPSLPFARKILVERTKPPHATHTHTHTHTHTRTRTHIGRSPPLRLRHSALSRSLFPPNSCPCLNPCTADLVQIICTWTNRLCGSCCSASGQAFCRFHAKRDGERPRRLLGTERHLQSPSIQPPPRLLGSNKHTVMHGSDQKL
jgi:hypothetical protein